MYFPKLFLILASVALVRLDLLVVLSVSVVLLLRLLVAALKAELVAAEIELVAI